jgi:uncharacterized membrane protein YqaE (UPF0057 family)
MKNQMVKIAATFVVAVTLFSCGSSRFTRSQYGHRDWSRGNYEAQEKTAPEQSAEKNRKSVQQPAEEVAVVTENNSRTEEVAVVTPAQKPVVSSVPVSQRNSETDVVIVNEESASETISPLAEEKTTPSSDATNGADTNTILLVILALFIPPLAVFLKDGSVSTMFWITLILCLVGGGWLWGWGYYFGGLYLIAIILAILYVLDMI